MILSEKYELIRKAAKDFAEAEFNSDLLDELEETGEYNWDIHKKIAENGYMGIRIPKQYEGQGGDYLAYAITIEEFSRVSPVLALYANTSTSLGSGPLLLNASEEQLQKYLPDIATGRKLVCFALTEPGAGSDAGSTTTTAIADGDDFILNGRKCFISGAPMADYAIVYARTNLKIKGNKGISCFMVDMKLPGISLGKHEKKMGIKGYPTSDIIFEDVRVSKDCLIGELDRGFIGAMKTLDGGRLGVAAQALGIAQAALDESIQYSKDRKQFGRRIADFQAISFMIADMATVVAAMREMVYNAAVMKDTNNPQAPMYCSMAKLFCTEQVQLICGKAIQIHGGYGFISDYKVERLYRDARVTTLYEGTSQVQQMVISGTLLK